MDGLPAHILSHPYPVASWDWESLKVKLASTHLKQKELCGISPMTVAREEEENHEKLKSRDHLTL